MPFCPHPTPIRQGFDEYMNLVLDDAEELDVKKETRRALGTSYRMTLMRDSMTRLVTIRLDEM